VETIYVGRFIVGIGTALSGIADIPYLTEISPPQYRGRLSSAYEFLAVVGIFSSFLVNLLMSQYEGSWRWLFGLPSLFAFLQGALMIFLPDSPKWLIQNGHYDVGRVALRQALDSEEEVTLKFNEIKEAHENLTAAPSTPSSSSPPGKLSESQAYQDCLFQYRWMFLCIMVLMFFQQFTGGVVVRNYATSIFRNAGFGDQAALTFTVVVGFVKVLTVGWSILNVRTRRAMS
jgi:MFS family permease